MKARLGLQGRMTVSYVVATVAIVVFIEAIAGALVLSHLTTGQDVTVRALDSAEVLAKKLGGVVATGGTLTPASTVLGPVKLSTAAKGEPLALVIDTRLHIVATNAPSTYPEGADVTHLLPAAALAQLRNRAPQSPKLGAAAVAAVPNGQRVWALVPIRAPVGSGVPAVDVELNPKDGVPIGTVGYAYVEAPAVKGYVLAHKLSSAVLVLLLTVPVGVVFGLATTRALLRRLRRLTEASQAVAAGDFSTRIAATSDDEVGQLERNFNDMTARLGEASQRELELASQNARLAERSRISRELHDSISQELFSLSLLAGGMQRALPEDSPLQPQVDRIAETVATAIHEMRALVLDLHPSALDDKGLPAALEDLCTAYRARTGLEVVARIDAVDLDSAAQHGLLRVAQEAFANAAKHSAASVVDVSLTAADGSAKLVVADDGRGFDPAEPPRSSGVGLRLMRERVGELGGVVTIESEPGRGTTVRVVVPITSAEVAGDPVVAGSPVAEATLVPGGSS